MTRFFQIALFVCCIALNACSGSKQTSQVPVQDPTKITWLSIEDVTKLMKKKPRKVLIDVYTDWCGWCKRMDSVTFSNPDVIKYVNENFYAVKFNAESKLPITFNSKQYEFVSNGQRGYHALAAHLLNNQMGYPSLAFLDEKMSLIQAFAGFKDPQGMDINLRFIAEDHYKKTSWRLFADQNGLKQ